MKQSKVKQNAFNQMEYTSNRIDQMVNICTHAFTNTHIESNIVVNKPITLIATFWTCKQIYTPCYCFNAATDPHVIQYR